MSASSMNLEIGRIGVQVSLDSGAFSPQILERYQPFLSRRKADYKLHLRKQSRAVSTRAWLPSIHSAGRAIQCRASQFEWDINLEPRSGSGRFRDTEQAFDSTLRALYSSVAPLHDGIILHSAALERNGKAYLFAGPSGAGKTTISRTLCPSPRPSPLTGRGRNFFSLIPPSGRGNGEGSVDRGVRTLTDELVLVRRHLGVFTVFATPFWGEFSRPDRSGSAPLEKIFLLKKSGDGPKRVPVNRIDAQQGLLKCLVSFQCEAEAIQRAWDFLWSMICAVPVEEFHWDKRDPVEKVVSLIDQP